MFHCTFYYHLLIKRICSHERSLQVAISVLFVSLVIFNVLPGWGGENYVFSSIQSKMPVANNVSAAIFALFLFFVSYSSLKIDFSLNLVLSGDPLQPPRPVLRHAPIPLLASSRNSSSHA